MVEAMLQFALQKYWTVQDIFPSPKVKMALNASLGSQTQLLLGDQSKWAKLHQLVIACHNRSVSAQKAVSSFDSHMQRNNWFDQI